jgi:hypothetical protein
MSKFSHICLWRPLCERITIWNKYTGQEMNGIVTNDVYHGPIIHWEKGTGPIVPMKKLYPLGESEWAIKARRKEWFNKYRREKYQKLKGLTAEWNNGSRSRLYSEDPNVFVRQPEIA